MDPADTSAGEMITLFEYFARLAAKSSANQSSHHQPARAGSMQVANCRPKVQQPSYQPTPQPAPQSLRLGIVRLQPACSERVSQPSTHQVPVCSPQACPGPQQALVKQWSSQDHVQQSRYVGTRLAIFTGNRGASKRRRGSHGTRQHWQSHQCSSTLSPQPRSSESSLPSLPEPLLPSHSEPLLPSAPESESPLPDSTANLRAAPPQTSWKRCSRNSTACLTRPTRYIPDCLSSTLECCILSLITVFEFEFEFAWLASRCSVDLKL